MELSRFNFEFDFGPDPEKSRYQQFHYNFGVLLADSSADAVLQAVNSEMARLEEVLDEVYLPFKIGSSSFNGNYIKQAVGHANRERVSEGMQYLPPGKADSIEFTLKLKYELSLVGGQLKSTEIVLMHNDDLNQERLLKVYDKILGLESLTIGEDAKQAIERVALLREGLRGDALIRALLKPKS